MFHQEKYFWKAKYLRFSKIINIVYCLFLLIFETMQYVATTKLTQTFVAKQAFHPKQNFQVAWQFQYRS